MCSTVKACSMPACAFTLTCCVAARFGKMRRMARTLSVPALFPCQPPPLSVNPPSSPPPTLATTGADVFKDGKAEERHRAPRVVYSGGDELLAVGGGSPECATCVPQEAAARPVRTHAHAVRFAAHPRAGHSDDAEPA